VSVTPSDDFVEEPDETVTVTIVPGAGYLAGVATATLTIRDDDANLAPVVSIISPTGGSALLRRTGAGDRCQCGRRRAALSFAPAEHFVERA
jgi:hypothetical protein